MLCYMSESVSTAAPAAPWVPSDGTFGARLALIRQRRGWNVKEAALACGIPPQSWRTWEGGVMPHGSRYFAVCDQIARTVGCDYGWLVDRRPSGTAQATVSKIAAKLRPIAGEGTDPYPRTPLLAVI